MSDKVAEKEQEQTENQVDETIIEEEVVADESVDESTQDSELDSLKAELAESQAEAAKNLDGWQRAAAELSNYKRRQEEQAGRRREQLTSDIISQIFPVLDDLDLAYQNMPEDLDEKTKNWLEGFGLVQRKLVKILDSYNVEVIETDGEFDPNLHEAITHEPSPDHESNAIIAELRKGYKMGERVLRPSMVRVAQ